MNKKKIIIQLVLLKDQVKRNLLEKIHVEIFIVNLMKQKDLF